MRGWVLTAEGYGPMPTGCRGLAATGGTSRRGPGPARRPRPLPGAGSGDGEWTGADVPDPPRTRRAAAERGRAGGVRHCRPSCLLPLQRSPRSR